TRPWVTYAVIAVCAFVFLGLNMESNPDTWEALEKWGVCSPDKVWKGAYWSLISSVAVHRAIWHLAFNMYWLAVLGTRLEYAIGSIWYLVLLLAAAVVSSGCELAVADTTGHGASGVVYAIFGFMLVLRDRFPGFREVVSRQTIQLFIAWLVICMATTYMNVWQVGNAAHLSGLLFGSAIAAVFVLKYKRALLVPALITLVLVSVVPVFWCPWSTTWLGVQATRAYVAGNNEQAIDYYGRLISKAPNAAWAYYNRGCSYYELGEDEKAKADFSQAAKIDPKYTLPGRKPGNNKESQ
ncbi:MAG: rhomboid family intramembrane serine protease, partial [Thermoguttaceae bacterium]